ncbi:MAG: lipid A biosynthesis acyltransferase, partial [Bacteroidota bacterium]
MIWLLSLFSRLPFFILYGISNFLFLIAFYLVGYRRKMVYQNLKNSFPDKSDREIRQFCRAFYLNLSDLLVETLKSLTISK